ncbi:ABC transporter substrate-binding protein [Candidatus Bipolaricaulota bacterium]|nr:ABC transporter substrate-binding protein [Candidatus Bipolaricaulota bacterium]MBS3793250.1 ABC transporter substrate-binding protein [Candidatus Bipolaricaulota bacterium]
MKKLSVLVLVVVFALGFGLVAGAQEAEKGGTLTIASGQNFKDLNPMVMNAVYDNYVTNQVFDELLTLDPETLEPKPYVAKDWEYSEDLIEITFYLNEGIEFHNGEKLTAEDVAFTFNWIINPDNGSPNRSEFAWLEEVEIVDEYTVKFITDEEYAPYAPGLVAETFAIVPKDTFLEMGREEFNQNPVGSGPFEFVEWKKGDHITLVKNEDYWLKDVNLDKVIFRPIPKISTMMLELQKGGVDITDTMEPVQVTKFQDMDNVKVMQTPGLNYFYVAFNMNREPYKNKQFRKAVYMSFDMTQAINSIFNSTAKTAERAYGAIPPALWASDEEYLKDNVALEENDEKAAELFETLEKQGVLDEDKTITVYSPPDPNRKKLATIMVTNLREHGLKAETQPLEWGAYLDLLYRGNEDPLGSEVDIFIIGWSGSPDPNSFTYYLFETKDNTDLGAMNNMAGYYDPLVQNRIMRAQSTMDQEKREELYVEAQRRIMSEYVHIPAYHQIETRGVNVKVHDYEPDPLSTMPLVNPFINVWIES